MYHNVRDPENIIKLAGVLLEKGTGWIGSPHSGGVVAWSESLGCNLATTQEEAIARYHRFSC